jgi:hypothetical protein
MHLCVRSGRARHWSRRCVLQQLQPVSEVCCARPSSPSAWLWHPGGAATAMLRRRSIVSTLPYTARGGTRRLHVVGTAVGSAAARGRGRPDGTVVGIAATNDGGSEQGRRLLTCGVQLAMTGVRETVMTMIMHGLGR